VQQLQALAENGGSRGKNSQLGKAGLDKVIQIFMI
jgi:hypothetical protein